MTDIKNLVLGVTVAAVVLIVVAVPVIGNLAGETTVVMTEGTDSTYYKPWNIAESDRITMAGSPTAVELSINDVPYLTLGLDDLVGSWMPIIIFDEGLIMYGPTDGVRIGGYNESRASQTGYDYNAVKLNNGSPSQLTSWTMTMTDGVWSITGGRQQDTYKTYVLGSDPYIYCDQSEATQIVCTSAEIPEGKDITVFQVYRRSNDDVLSIITRLNTTASTSETVMTSTVSNKGYLDDGLVYNWPNGLSAPTDGIFSTVVQVIQDEAGFVSTGNGSGSMNLGGTDYSLTASTADGRILAEIGFEVSHESEYAYLIWLLPVMLAVVLIASVAYQIVPKRRNTE